MLKTNPSLERLGTESAFEVLARAQEWYLKVKV